MRHNCCWLQCALFPSPGEGENPDLLEAESAEAAGGLAFLLGLWVLSLWNEGAVLSEAAKVKGMEVLLILCASFLLWMLINKMISRYLDSREKNHAESEEDVDSLFGEAIL